MSRVIRASEQPSYTGSASAKLIRLAGLATPVVLSPARHVHVGLQVARRRRVRCLSIRDPFSVQQIGGWRAAKVLPAIIRAGRTEGDYFQISLAGDLPFSRS